MAGVTGSGRADLDAASRDQSGANLQGLTALLEQLIGVAATGVFCFGSAYALFFIINKTLGLRVSREEELNGLDIGEHGMEAYAGFQFFSN